MRVKVYYNLHKFQLSVVAMEGAQKGIVIAHAKSILLGDVVFKVFEAGRQRVIRERRKNVHAYVQGDLINIYGMSTERGKDVITYDMAICSLATSQIIDWRIANEKVVSYNPYNHPQFYRVDTDEYVYSAPEAYLDDNRRIWI